MIMRISLTITAILLAGMMSGCCCGPINNCGSSCGGGCGAPCGPCVSPLNAMAQVRKAFVCGTGCGEAYTDEWCSTPPDACDPCVGGQFVGGATPCVPQCWYPGRALFGFLGGVANCANQRLCQFCNCVSSQCTCGGYAGGCSTMASTGGCCGDAGCGGGCGAQAVSGEVIHSGGGGCATCSSNNGASSTRVAEEAPPIPNQRVAGTNPRTARANAMQRNVSRASSYHTRNTLYR